MRQTAPDPTLLEELVGKLSYRPGWRFTLEDIQRDQDHGRGTAEGLTFCVYTKGYNSYHVDRGENYGVVHYFPVPAATYNAESWLYWIREQLVKVEEHELNEFLQIDGERPFAPHHGPGWDPYVTLIHGSALDASTSFRGTVNT